MCKQAFLANYTSTWTFEIKLKDIQLNREHERNTLI